MLGITPASEFLSALTMIMNRIVSLLLSGAGLDAALAGSALALHSRRTKAREIDMAGKSFLVRLDSQRKNRCTGSGKTENTPANPPSLALRQGIRFSKPRALGQLAPAPLGYRRRCAASLDSLRSLREASAGAQLL